MVRSEVVIVDFRITIIIDPSRATGGTRKVRRELDRTTKSANSLRSALGRAFAILATGAVIASATRTLAGFAQEMSTVAAVTNATEEEFARLEERAISLGTNTRFTATQAASGLTELARAGLSVEESLTAVGTALTLAQAGALSIASAAAITTTAIKVFKLEAADAAAVTDTLVIAANNAKTNVSEMGQAFTFVAANAKDLGIDVNDTAAALAVLAEGGLTATRGGTALRAVLLGLAAPTRAAEKAILAAGLSLEEVNIQSRGLLPVLKTLSDANLDTAAKTDIFGKRFSAASSILFDNIPLFDELNEKFDTLGGEAQRVADVMDDNLNGAILATRSAFEGLTLRLGQSGAQGALRSFFDTLTSVLRSAADNIEQFINVLEGLAFVLSVTLARRAIGAVIVAIKALGLAILTNPIGVFVTAVTLATGALISFGRELTITKDSTTTFGDVLTAVIDQGKNLFLELKGVIGELAKEIDETLGTSFAGLELNLQNVLLFVAAFADRTVGLLQGIGNTLIAVFDGVGPAIGSAFFVIINGVINLIESATDRTLAFFNAIATTSKVLGLGLLNFFREIDVALTQLAQGQIAAAATTAGQAADLLERQLGGVGSTFTRILKSELLALEGERLLDNLDNPFAGKGKELAESMSEGFFEGLDFSASTDFILAAIDTANAQRGQADAAAALAASQRAANQEQQEGIPITEALGESTGAAAAATDDLALSMSDGLAKGLETAIEGITDVSGAAETLVVNAFGAAEDAIVDFATTGKFEVSALVDGILADFTRILVRKAILALINSFGDGGGGGGAGGIVNTLATRAHGGPLAAGQPAIVGEEGPELFVPRGAGNIMPAGQTSAALGGETVVQAPAVNLQVINVSDPAEVIAALNSPEGVQTIINIISTNPTAVNNGLSG